MEYTRINLLYVQNKKSDEHSNSEGNYRKILTVSTEAGTARIVRGMYATALTNIQSTNNQSTVTRRIQT